MGAGEGDEGPSWHRHLRLRDALAADRELLEPEFKSGFRFTQPGFDIDDFHVVWLISIDSSTATAMTNAELTVLATFMDGGGGILATGDHANLGAPLCGRIPRVRSMRNWQSPPPIGPDRNDATQAGSDTAYTFDDQSDAVPQPITPRWYGTSFSHPYLSFSNRYPHPILCGPRGVIEILPDHMHEGECVEPADLDATVTDIPGYGGDEWPSLTGGGGRLGPEVIAWSKNVPGHTMLHIPLFGSDATDPDWIDDETLSQAKTYGAIGAYDGHRAGRRSRRRRLDLPSLRRHQRHRRPPRHLGGEAGRVHRHPRRPGAPRRHPLVLAEPRGLAGAA